MAAPIITAGLGLLAPIAANAAGIGKNDTRAKSFAESGQYDPNRFEYGGQAGQADATASRFSGLASGAQGRNAAQANYGQANSWDAQSQYARQAQGNVAGLMMNRATGATPSIAGQQAQLDMGRATAAQASAAASARGAGGLALAGQNAANNTATMQSAISNQAQINGAAERMQAEQGAMGAYSAMRGGDQASQGMAAAQAQYQAGLQAQQRQANDAYSMGLYNQEAGVRNAQLTAGMNQQNLMAGSHQSSTNTNVAISQNNANREYEYYKQAMGAAQGGADGATASGLAGGGGSAPSASPGLGSSSAATNMVGIPAAGGGGAASPTGLGSDDRMKFGMSPLSGLLGPSGNAGSSGGAPASFDVLNGDGSMDVMASAKAHSNYGTRFESDPSGGMMGGGGLLSDDNAKRAAYAIGRQDGVTQGQYDEAQPWRIGAPLAAGETLTLRKNGEPHIQPAPRYQSDEQEDWIRANYDRSPEVRNSSPTESIPRHDPITSQFAQGLAPIRFQYKPGMGPAGEQTGVRAQQAASQPVTASMVQRRPDGLMQLDPAMGLGTALAGVGHLAKKQQNNEELIQKLFAAQDAQRRPTERGY